MAEGRITQATLPDHKSPFYLHPSDHPGLVFVTQPLNDSRDNYFVWRKAFMNALRSKNKAGFLDGSIKFPDVASTEYSQWQQCNDIVLSWLSNALVKELQGAAAHAEMAQEVWLDLEEKFTQRVDARVYELRRTIAGLRQEKSHISTYYGCLKSIWGELQFFDNVQICNCGKCTCGLTKTFENVREKEMVFDFLIGLDETFNTMRSHILSIDLLPNLGQVYALVAQEEKQRSVARNLIPQLEAGTMMAWPSNTGAGVGRGSQKSSGRGQRPRYTYCIKLGHLLETCYKLIGYPPDYCQHRAKGGQKVAGSSTGGQDASIHGKGLAVTFDSTNGSPTEGTALHGPNNVFAGLTLAQQQQLSQFLGHLKGNAAGLFQQRTSRESNIV